MKVKLLKREREKRARKSLGFHIQLGFKAMSHERILRANYLIICLFRALYLVFGKETQTGEDRGFHLSLVFSVLFSVFALYSNRQRRSIL